MGNVTQGRGISAPKRRGLATVSLLFPTLSALCLCGENVFVPSPGFNRERFAVTRCTSFLLERGMLVLCVNPTEASSWIDASGELLLAHPEVIRCYYRDIDATLIRENLKLTPVQRLRKLEEFVAFINKLEGAERQTRCLR